MSYVRKPVQVAVLNAIAATAVDLSLSKGRLSTVNAAGPTIKNVQITGSANRSVTKTAYAAGTARIYTYQLSAITLTANTPYTVYVNFPNYQAFPGGGQESDQFKAVKAYTIYSGDSTPTAANIATLLAAHVNADPNRLVDAAVVSSTQLSLTAKSVTYGDFLVTWPTGATSVSTTAYVAPSGTPAIVEYFSPGSSSSAAQYTTWKITANALYHNNAISGLQAFKEVDVYIFANELDADFGDFETALDAILDGTHTPVADYL